MWICDDSVSTGSDFRFEPLTGFSCSLDSSSTMVSTVKFGRGFELRFFKIETGAYGDSSRFRGLFICFGGSTIETCLFNEGCFLTASATFVRDAASPAEAADPTTATDSDVGQAAEGLTARDGSFGSSELLLTLAFDLGTGVIFVIFITFFGCVVGWGSSSKFLCAFFDILTIV